MHFHSCKGVPFWGTLVVHFKGTRLSAWASGQQLMPHRIIQILAGGKGADGYSLASGSKYFQDSLL